MIPNCKNKTEGNKYNTINKNMYMITAQMMGISEDVLADYPDEVAYLQKLADDVLNASDYNDYPIVYITNTNTPNSPVAAIISKYTRRYRLIEISSILPASSSVTSTTKAHIHDINILGTTIELRLDANDKVKSCLQKDTNNEIGFMKLPFLSTEFDIAEGVEPYTPTNNYHPATKKYVDDEIYNNLYRSYTTGETLSGDIWIDGEPIYRKVININTEIKNGYVYAHNIANLTNIIKVSGYGKVTENAYVPINSCLSNGPKQYNSCVCVEGSNVIFYLSNDREKFISANVIIEYTRTL